MKLSKKIVPRWGFQPGTNIAIAIVAVSAKKEIVPRWGFQPATNIAIAIVAGEFVRRQYVVLHDAVNCFEDVSGLVALGWARSVMNSYFVMYEFIL